jgi:two-component system, LuxR family, sensor kinase FixL
MDRNCPEPTRDADVACLQEQLAAERQARMAAQELLRETHAAMIKHQQVGRMGDFRYNTRTGESRGSLECYKLFGFDAALSAIDFATWTDKIHPDDRPAVVKALSDAIAALTPIQFEYRILLDGEMRYIRCEGQPDFQHVGDVMYYGVVSDITERRALDESLRRAEAQLASSLRLASVALLARSIVHEINQPLAAIVTSADACRRWMAAGPYRSERALASLGRVISESQRATAVASGLKTLIRESGAATASLEKGS